ncbi:GNAT family N-acetyltransferase [Leptolyngbya sp. FACHB-671]|uniref:GNAT family N-acetyltransferase n=1 Tax=Leptolyngbya sp. FACHB-671 TaxID=2692812 RepID=UPI00321F68FD
MAIPADYVLWSGSGLDRALLVKFMQRTYQELYPDQSFAHLARTVEQYFSKETPLWWVGQSDAHKPEFGTGTYARSPIACLWLGNAIDQVRGDRHSHIFLLYVLPAHRRKGIGSALMHHAEEWAKERGDRQMGLQVFVANQPAISLYQKLGYTSQSVWMVKPLI